MSQSEWKGSIPQRFSGGRKHVQPNNEISSGLLLSLNRQAKNGIRTFTSSLTPEAIFKPHQKIFEDKHTSVTQSIDLKGIKRVELPARREKIRPQRIHNDKGRETEGEITLRGIRSFHTANQSSDRHLCVENEMQKKREGDNLSSMRNSLRVASTGGKPYRYPDYEANFYKKGGLVPGSTHKPRINEVPPEIKKGSVLTKPMWDVKVKMDEIQEDVKYLDSIDQWEQTILKENNPNWKDPDVFLAADDPAQKDLNPKKLGNKK